MTLVLQQSDGLIVLQALIQKLFEIVLSLRERGLSNVTEMQFHAVPKAHKRL